jgi:hypothetical protein
MLGLTVVVPALMMLVVTLVPGLGVVLQDVVDKREPRDTV